MVCGGCGSMSYNGPVRPDWCEHILVLKETLEEILLQISEDERTGKLPDISCLEAYDTLEQHLAAVKRDLGI